MLQQQTSLSLNNVCIDNLTPDTQYNTLQSTTIGFFVWCFSNPFISKSTENGYLCKLIKVAGNLPWYTRSLLCTVYGWALTPRGNVKWYTECIDGGEGSL